MTQIPEKYELLATAYVLGQCTPEQLAECEQLIANEPLFSALLEDMEASLSPLIASIPDAEPPADLFDDIMQQIDADDRPSMFAAERGFWRPMAMAASFIAMVSVGSHLLPNSPPQTSPKDLMALLAQQDAPGLVVIVYDPADQQIVARLSGVTAPDDGVWELWRIREGGDGPVSLGVVPTPDTTGRVVIQLDEPLSSQLDTLAISLEPQGGSPAAGPTGPVLFVGGVDEI